MRISIVSSTRGLVDVHRGEAALEGRVLLDVLAVLVQGGRADDVQLAAGQGRLHHRRGVDCAFGAAGPDHLMDLVQEEDDLAVRLTSLVHDSLQALFELAAELGARDQGAHVEGHHPLVTQVLRHVTHGDLLGQALDDGGLADTGLADDHGVVLGAPVQDLHDAPDLVLAADHRVQLALGSEVGQVDRVLLQGAVVALGARALDAGGAAHLLERLVDALLVDAGLAQDARGLAVALVRDRDQDVLDADVLVLEALGLGVRRLQHAHDARRDVDLHALARGLRRAAEHAGDAVADLVRGHAELVEDAPGQAVLVGQQGQEYVLDVPLRVTLLAHVLLRFGQHLLRLLCEPVLSHHVRVPTCLIRSNSINLSTKRPLNPPPARSQLSF